MPSMIAGGAYSYLALVGIPLLLLGSILDVHGYNEATMKTDSLSGFQRVWVNQRRGGLIIGRKYDSLQSRYKLLPLLQFHLMTENHKASISTEHPIKWVEDDRIEFMIFDKEKLEYRKKTMTTGIRWQLPLIVELPRRLFNS